MIEKNEKWTGLFHFIMSRLLMLSILIVVITSYYIYFTSDDGHGSLHMPFAAM